MGWSYFSNKTREELVVMLVKAERNGERSLKTLDYCLVESNIDDVLWCVVECIHSQTGEEKRFIECILINQCEGDWGYKAMSESMHPLYYSCPLPFLARVSTACQEWREKVKKYHRLFTPGQWVALDNCKIPKAQIVTIDPLIGVYNNCQYRLTRDLIGDVLQS
ncbi:MAG: hypothetical protein V3W04_06545 [Gammaproteobacteria bacterium]